MLICDGEKYEAGLEARGPNELTVMSYEAGAKP